MSTIYDLGHRFTVRFVADDIARYVALAVRHGECGAETILSLDLPWNDGPQEKYQITSWEPLTVEPSVVCPCGTHGWIRCGSWVPITDLGRSTEGAATELPTIFLPVLLHVGEVTHELGSLRVTSRHLQVAGEWTNARDDLETCEQLAALLRETADRFAKDG
jgi:hypothetical protein